LKILIICPHPEGIVPGQRLKYEQYFDYFRSHGIEVTVSPFISENFQTILYKKGFFLLKVLYTIKGYFTRIADFFRLRSFDGLYIFLYVTPFGFPFFEFLFTKMQPNYVYDIDDLVFLKRKNQINPLIEWIRGRSKIPFLIKHAKHVITCTPYLNDYALTFNQHTTDISSTINTDTYRPKSIHLKNKKVVIGWSGSHSTAPYLYQIENVLNKINLKYDIEILIIGDPSFSFSKLAVEAIPWNRDTEVADLQRIDIGVYPLPDEEWVLGKSGLKALQYMALGIPTVATAIGANFRIIDHGRNGFLVHSEEEWFNTLQKLILDPNLRKTIGDEGRRKVNQFYSVIANQSTYLEILKKVLINPGNLK
jgi:glycosyltransferase involved in cell wall biosynthesis